MRIDPALEALAVPISTIQPHPRNARRGNSAEIARSLTRFGQLRPVIVQESTGYIVAGNHTFAAALSLGARHVAALLVPMTDDEALDYLLADNRASDRATYNDAALALILADLADAGRLDGTGYTPDDVDDLLARLDAHEQSEPQPTGARHAEDGDADDRTRIPAAPLTEVILGLDAEDSDRFDRSLAALQPRYGTNGIADTVLRAVHDAASGEAPS